MKSCLNYNETAAVAAAAALTVLCQCVNEDAEILLQISDIVSDFTTCDLCRQLELKPKGEQGEATFNGGGGTGSGMTSAECQAAAHPVTPSLQSAPGCLFNWQIRIKKHTCCYAARPVLQKKIKK